MKEMFKKIATVCLSMAMVFGLFISIPNAYAEETEEIDQVTVEEPTVTEEPVVVEEPTIIPTVEATLDPTEEPTAETTVEPTIEPTIEATLEPIVEETVEPTLAPVEEIIEEEVVEEVPAVEAVEELTTEPVADAIATEPEITNFAASASTIDDSCFIMNGSTLVGYDMDRCGTDVVVPAEVNGVAITDIGQMAFYRKPITSLDISAIENLNSFGFQTLCGSQLFDFVAGDLSNTTFYDGGNMGSSELDWNTYVANGIVRDDQLTIDMNQIKNWSSTFDPNNVAEVSLDWGNAGPLTYDKASGLATGNVFNNPAVMFYNYTAPSESHYNGWDAVVNGNFGTLCVGLGISYTYQFKATFQNDDGTILGQDWYNQNSSAVAPTTPTKAGYTFTGWDVDFSNMIQNILVTAQYTKNPDPTPVPATPTPTPNPGRTCQDDGYPAGYYWNGTACVIDVVPTPNVTNEPQVIITTPTTETEVAAVVNEVETPEETAEAKAEVVATPVSEVQHPEYGNKDGNWALLNLICALCSMILGIIIVASKTTKEDEDETYYERNKTYKLLSAIMGIASILVFVFTENIQNPIVLVDKWSILMVALLLGSVVFYAFGIKWHEKTEDTEDIE